MSVYTGFDRASKFTLNKTIDGVLFTYEYLITDAFSGYQAISVDDLMSLPIGDYNQRVNSLYALIKQTHVDFSEVTDLTNSGRTTSITCSVPTTTTTTTLPVTTTTTTLPPSVLKIYDGIYGRTIFNGDVINISTPKTITLLNFGNVNLIITSINITGSFSSNLSLPHTIFYTGATGTTITYTGGAYTDGVGIMNIVTDSENISIGLSHVGYTTTTTTTTPPVPTLLLTWDDIVNVPVADPNSLVDWNTFFGLGVGFEFTDIVVNGNIVSLKGSPEVYMNDNLFMDNLNLIGIEDVNGIIYVAGNYVFVNCINLVSATLPNLTDAWTSCFSSTSIPNIYFPSLMNAGDGCFNNCLSTYSIDLPNLINAGVGCFEGLASPESFLGFFATINAPLLETIGESCFYGCGATKVFDFPLLTNIPNYGFHSCISATVMNMPLITNAGMNAFDFCGSIFNPIFDGDSNIVEWRAGIPEGTITTFNFPNLQYAGNNCFYSCTGIENFSFPALISAGNSCFNGCWATSYDFPSLVSISNYTFYNCWGYDTFNLPSLINMGSDVYDNGVFGNSSGQILTLTIPSALMICNAGNPDGDIQYLQANNTVTIIQV